MKTKFNKGDQVILKTKLTSDPLTVVNVTTTKEEKHRYYGMFLYHPRHVKLQLQDTNFQTTK